MSTIILSRFYSLWCQCQAAMTRVDTRPDSVFIKQRTKTSNFCQLLSVFIIVITCIVAYFSFPCDSFIHLSDDLAFTRVADVYNSPEAVDPEDRNVFEGFKTSFLPEDEVMLAHKQHISSRIKRMSHLPIFSYQYSDMGQNDDRDGTDDYFEDEECDKDDTDHTKMSVKYESKETNEEYDDNDGLESVVPPEPHMDRGPLDDVVEQIRGQPELEEEEMGSSVHAFKPARSYTVLHSFWKGQGDSATIRQTQAHIMKQYMDAEADPCEDFYQYACGNWAGLNPIPADKAGYDTFEMLRENLDIVLKDLLEFKKNETFPYKFPGKHLKYDNIYMSHNFLDNSSDQSNIHRHKVEHFLQDKRNQTHGTKVGAHRVIHNKNKFLRSKKLSRIRRYLHEPSNEYINPLSYNKNRNDVNKYMNNKRAQLLKQIHAKSHKRALIKKKLSRKIKPKNHGRKLLSHFSGLRRKPAKINKVNLKSIPHKNNSHIEVDDPAHGDAALKARFLFESCMNYDILKQRGHQPLLDLLQLLGGWPILDPKWDQAKFDWLKLMAQLRLYNNDILLSEWVGPDIKNSNEFVIQFDQTSLGLPTRDYFLQSNNNIYLEAYKKYLLTIALLLGGDSKHVHKSADELINFEIRLAKITSAPEDRRNVSELYRRMPLEKLEDLVPEVQWTRYLCIVMNRTVQPNETVVLFALPYVRNLIKLIQETKPSTLSNYLLWRFVRHRVNNLDDRFQTAKQQFYFILFGREQAPPRWKNCISQVNSNMGMALGSMFVRKYFDETSKNDTLTMTREIQQSFRELLHTIDWIDGATKSLASQKVDAIMLRIGYPDFILNKVELDDRYKEVMIHPDKYFENILNILQHLTKMEQSRIGQPVNKSLWNTAPAVVNAYYSRNKNQIMFPAGILQPPFYHRNFPRSLNYGGIGVVIGHEITHGFDDKGRLFDCDGNLHRWWSDSAIEQFHRRAQGLIDQYGKYVVPEVNMKLDGVNTQGENIADNGGVKQAFRAYLRWLKKHGSKGETLPGLNHTHTQLFFLNFAQVWCGAMRPEAMRNKLKTAVHSPGRFRVIGTLSNSHDFAREFNCPVGAPMNPEKKCSVW